VECGESVREKPKPSVEVGREGWLEVGARWTVGEVNDEEKTWYFCVCGFWGITLKCRRSCDRDGL